MSGYYYDYDGDESPPPYSDVELMDTDTDDYYNTYETPGSPGNAYISKPKRAPTTMKAVPKKCRTCGNPGHDSRNCAMNKGFTGKDKKVKEKAAPPPPPPVPQKASRPSKTAEEKACGACRQIGHDRRCCPKLLGLPVTSQQEDTTTAAMKKLVESMLTATAASLSPEKQKSKPKRETVSKKAAEAKTQPTKSSRGKAAPSLTASTFPITGTRTSNPPVRKQTARRSRPFTPAAASGRGQYVPAVESTWQMEPEEEKSKSRPLQTARRSKPLAPRGSRGGSGVTKKASEPATKKKAAATTKANSIKFTINLG